MGVLVAVAVSATLVAGVAPAQAGPEDPTPDCRFSQSTRLPGGNLDSLAVSTDGERVAFTTNANPTGANADHSYELFEVALANGRVTQLTSEPAGTSFFHLAASADLSVLSYVSNRTDAGNAAGDNELFVSDRSAGTLERLTGAESVEVTLPEVDGAGEQVVFEAEGDVNGANPDGSREIWLHDRGTDTTTAITDTPAEVAWFASPTSPAISTDGTTIAYRSGADPLGSNADGNPEAFVYRPEGDQLTQATETDPERDHDGVNYLELDGDGDTLAVQSSIELDGTPTTPEATLTVLDPFGDEAVQVWKGGNDLSVVYGFDIDDAGERIGYGPSELGATQRPVVVQDVEGAPVQITHDANGLSALELSGDGDRLIWEAINDALGQNPDHGGEVFLGDCRTFRDVASSHPFAEDIEWLAAEGIAQGYPDGGFHPAAVVSRQAAAAFLYRLAGEPEVEAPAEPTFADVPLDHPFATEIEWAAAEEITGGYPDGGFHPAADVTRQAFAAFLFRLTDPVFEAPGEATFDDVALDHPFFTEIEWAADEEITGGYPDGGFHPAAVVTRQATAAFLHRWAEGPGAD